VGQVPLRKQAPAFEKRRKKLLILVAGGKGDNDQGKREKKKDEGMRHLYEVLSRLDGPGISSIRVQTRLTFDAASKKVIVTN